MEERLFGDESSLNGFDILLLPRPHVSFSLHADIAVGPNSISPSFLNVVQPTKAYSYIFTLKFSRSAAVACVLLPGRTQMPFKSFVH